MALSKPFILVLIVQSIYAGYFMLTKIAFDFGTNPYVFVFYRQAFATIFLMPFALFFEGKKAPPLAFSILIKIFMLSLLGITMSLDIVGLGLKYTSASLGAATTNTLPVITFFLAVIFRMEKVNIKTSHGIMKLAGVLLCAIGVVTIAFYRGPLLKLLLRHHFIKSHLHHNNDIPSPHTWIKGVFLVLLANIAWAFWLVLQGRVLKNYPSKLLLTTLQCFLSTVQSFLIAFAFTRDPMDWQLKLDISLLSIAYCGIVVTGITFYLQTWVIEMKGPVFLAMTTPLIFAFTIVLSAFMLGEIISLGSVLGALLLMGGLYFVLWGKTKEEERRKVATTTSNNAEKGVVDEVKEESSIVP